MKLGRPNSRKISVGTTIRNWTVVDLVKEAETIRKRIWLVRCQCDEGGLFRKMASEEYLLYDTNQKCRRCMKGFDDMRLVGLTFGKWKVLRCHSHGTRVATKWWCRCTLCNETEKAIPQQDLEERNTDKCDKCFRREGWVGELSKDYWQRVVRRATRKKQELTISQQYALDIYLAQNKRCALSGLLIPMRDKKESLGTESEGRSQIASLDRIDSSKGYILGNVQWLHKDINAMKGDLSDDELILWCHLIAEHTSRDRPIVDDIEDDGERIGGEYWGTVRQGAISRDYRLLIEPDQAFDLLVAQKFRCSLSGVPIRMGRRRRQAGTKTRWMTTTRTASLDRIDSTKDYTLDNLQWIHKDLQFVKQDFSDEYLIELCTAVADHHRQKKEVTHSGI